MIESAAMSPTGTWAPAVIVGEAPGDSFSPDIALTATGESIAVWTNYEGGTGHYQVESATRPALGVWTEPSVIGTSDEVDSPLVAVDPAGDATVVWWGWITAEHHYATWAEQRPAGGTWGPQLSISEPGEETYFPAVDMDGTGGTGVAWGSEEGVANIRSLYLPATKPAPEPEPVVPTPTPTPSPSPTGDSGHSTAAAGDTKPGPAICTAVSASPSAESYVPSPKPGATVPGVRARITVGVPSNVEVAATLSYQWAGKRHSVAAGEYSMSVASKQNLRIPLPSALRAKLPVGSKVGVSLRIGATPVTTAGCGGTPSTSVNHLKLKVVKVLTAS